MKELISKAQLRRFGPPAMFVFAAVLALTDLVTVISRVGSASDARATLKDYESRQASAAENKPPDPNSSAGVVMAQMLDRVNQRNVFSPPRPTGQFSGKLIGVLGNQVLMQDNKLVSVGEMYQNGKLLRVGPDWAEFEVDGKSVNVPVNGSQGGPGGPGGPPQMAGGPMPGGPGRPMPSMPMGPNGPRPNGMPAGIPPELLERMRNRPTTTPQ